MTREPDIVARLRAIYATHPMVMEAADEIEQLRAALTGAETVMMIVEPRSHKGEYLEALAAIRAALEPKP